MMPNSPDETPEEKQSAIARSKVPAGGKAKASKGKGRAPAVKGQVRQGKKRQSR